MRQPDSNLHREAFVFMKKAEQNQNHSRFFLTEEEFYTVPAKPYAPGIWDALLLNFGNWLIRIGHDLKTRSLYTKLSEKQV